MSNNFRRLNNELELNEQCYHEAISDQLIEKYEL